jgi:hypothetical protein
MLKTNKLHKPERNAELIAMREAGATWAELGRRFGMATSSARRVFYTHTRKRKAGP